MSIGPNHIFWAYTLINGLDPYVQHRIDICTIRMNFVKAANAIED